LISRYICSCSSNNLDLDET